MDGGREGTGRHSTLPFIRRVLGKNKIDMIVLTHYHDDHTGGVADLLEHISVGKLVSSGVYSTGIEGDGIARPADLPQQVRLDAALLASETPHQIVTENDVKNDGVPFIIYQDGDFTVDVIIRASNNPAGIPNGALSHLITRWKYGDFTYIHTSDVTNIEDYLGVYPDLAGQVLYIPHHGDLAGFKADIVNAVSGVELCIVGDYQSNDSQRSFFTNLNKDAWFFSVDGKLKISANLDGTFTATEDDLYVTKARAT